MQNFHTSHSKYLLALHSCSEFLGIAIKDTNNPREEIKTKIFNIGHSLSNKLLSSVETLIPKRFWKKIIRISVAKGPGSYTSTRLTLSMARTISQQLDCSLDAMSSFHLMAPRLHELIKCKNTYTPFWIKDILPRRGVLAGKYELIKIHQKSNFHEFNEIVSPQLIRNEKELNPSVNALNNIEEDIFTLIKFSQFCHDQKMNSNWQNVLPIYPTSPIDNNKNT